MGYGYGPPAPGYFAGYPPRKAPPKKLWYGVGAALLIVGLLLTAFGAVSMIGHFADAAPDAEHTFANGEMTTVHFDAGETKVIFVANPGEFHKVRCNVGAQTGSDDEATIDNYDGGLTINQWQAVFTVTAQQSSDYAVTCEGAPSDKFAVGGDVNATSLVGSVVGLSGGGLLCLVGIVTLIVTAILRHRRAV